MLFPLFTMNWHIYFLAKLQGCCDGRRSTGFFRFFRNPDHTRMGTSINCQLFCKWNNWLTKSWNLVNLWKKILNPINSGGTKLRIFHQISNNQIPFLFCHELIETFFHDLPKKTPWCTLLMVVLAVRQRE